MNKVYAIIKRITAIMKLAVMKILHPSRIRFGFNESLSLSTVLRLQSGGHINLGNKVSTNGRVEILASGGKVRIGKGCFFNNNCMVVPKEEITIGEHCMFGPNTIIFDHDHVFKGKNGTRADGFITKPIKIGRDVWCGVNVAILKGVKLVTIVSLPQVRSSKKMYRRTRFITKSASMARKKFQERAKENEQYRCLILSYACTSMGRNINIFQNLAD